MATPAQITANRLNAQKSTGPASEEGRAVSRFNALKHCASAKSLVIPGEDESQLEALAASYREQFQPDGPEEALLLEKIVSADWTQRRMYRLEAEVFSILIAREDESVENPLGAAFIKDCEGPKALQKILRCREAASREWYRALAELRYRQSLRIADPPPSPPVETEPPAPEAPAPMPDPNAKVRASHAPAPPQAPHPAPAPAIAPRGKIGFVFDERTPPAWRL